ncbi:response regulator [Desulfovibrio sp. JC010]|uniref:response regulator n=1 Tax=Desulfovibrio sp. JC010 TaxID=2593641 RepID=UPI0013D20E54|nr:response regulator [Desulfovibrio sp. JC010]NDV25078.1 response regulator [Desulfovibrio sp. JC010]
MQILIVEDSNTSRMYLREILRQITKKLDASIDCAVCGEEALEKFEHKWLEGTPYNLIFMDIILPGMDGLQALEKIRAIEQAKQVPEDMKAKAIMTTALDDSTKASRAFFQCEALSYITKPITAQKIQAELSKFGMI